MAKRTKPKAPKRLPLPDHLVRTATGAAVTAVVVDLLVASLATSRATAHVLSALAVGGIVAGAAAVGTTVGWANGLYGGADDVLRGATVLGCEPGCRAEPDGDPWGASRLWRTTLTWVALTAAWAGAGAALVAVALNGKRARLIVLFVALLGLAGVASVVVDTVARHRGAHAARSVLALSDAPTPLRRRAWRQVALPLGLSQLLVNAGFSWVLFHGYSRGDAFAPHALTRSVALADVTTIVIIVAVIFGSLAARWGGVDARLGRVVLDEAEVQEVSPKSPMGVQGVVYIALLGLVLGKLAGLALSPTPSLLAVAVVRGSFAGLLTFAATGVAFVRGAVNATAVATTGAPPSPTPPPPGLATDTPDPATPAATAVGATR